MKLIRDRFFRAAVAVLAQTDRSRLLVLFILGLGMGSDALAQRDVPGVLPKADAIPFATDSVRASALAQINTDYRAFVDKRAQLWNRYQDLSKNLRDTEVEIQNINAEGVRQQMAMIQSMLSAMSFAPQLSNPTPPAMTRPFLFDQNWAAREQAIDRLNMSMRAQEIAQLDTAAQASLRRRIECLQKMMQTQQELADWYRDWPDFIRRYWGYGDPERQYSKSDNQAILQTLAGLDSENYPAMIVSAMLMERVGRLNDGLVRIDQVLEAKTPLQPIAHAVKALLLTAQDEPKLAKAEMVSAIKLGRTDPHVRWIRAQFAAQQQQWSVAETEWNTLAKNKDFEIAARRGLALMSSVRSAKSPREANRAVSQAQTAKDIASMQSWYGDLVLAIAEHAARRDNEALKHLDSAERLAHDDNLELCQQIRKSIAEKSAFQWDFLRR